MNLKMLYWGLRRNFDLPISVRGPDGKMLPSNFDIIEVGVVAKNMKDCLGETKSSAFAYLQFWATTDFEYRLNSRKLHDMILNTGHILVDALDVLVEYQHGTVSLYRLESVVEENGTNVLQLSNLRSTCASSDYFEMEHSF